MSRHEEVRDGGGSGMWKFDAWQAITGLCSRAYDDGNRAVQLVAGQSPRTPQVTTGNCWTDATGNIKTDEGWFPPR